MNRPADIRELWLSYRLDELSPEARRAVEEQIFADPSFSDELEEAEVDLLDDYQAGRLSGNLKSRAERVFADLPASSYALARSLAKKFRAPKARRMGYLSIHRHTWLRAVAAGIVIVVAVAAYFLNQRLGTQTEMPSAASNRPTPQQQGSIPSGAKEPDEPLPEGKSNSNAAIRRTPDVSILLLGQEASRDSEPLRLELLPTSRLIEIQWIVPEIADDERYMLKFDCNGRTLTLQQSKTLQKNGIRLAEFRSTSTTFRKQGLTGNCLVTISSTKASQQKIAQYSVAVYQR